MNKILVWILLMAIAGILITMMLIALAPYIAAAFVLWLTFRGAKKLEPEIPDDHQVVDLPMIAVREPLHFHRH